MRRFEPGNIEQMQPSQRRGIGRKSLRARFRSQRGIGGKHRRPRPGGTQRGQPAFGRRAGTGQAKPRFCRVEGETESWSSRKVFFCRMQCSRKNKDFLLYAGSCGQFFCPASRVRGNATTALSLGNILRYRAFREASTKLLLRLQGPCRTPCRAGRFLRAPDRRHGHG